MGDTPPGPSWSTSERARRASTCGPGIQFLPFNTLYQLAALEGTDAFARARTMLLMPDLLGYWLTGEVAAEETNASTTGLLDARPGSGRGT